MRMVPVRQVFGGRTERTDECMWPRWKNPNKVRDRWSVELEVGEAHVCVGNDVDHEDALQKDNPSEMLGIQLH